MKKNEDFYVETFISLSNFVERWIKVLLLTLFILFIVAQLLLQSDMSKLISPLERLEGIPYKENKTARDNLYNQLGS